MRDDGVAFDMNSSSIKGKGVVIIAIKIKIPIAINDKTNPCWHRNVHDFTGLACLLFDFGKNIVES